MSGKGVGGVLTAEQQSVVESVAGTALARADHVNNAYAVAQLRLLLQEVRRYQGLGLIQKRSPYFDDLERAVERSVKFLDLPPPERGELPTPLGWQPGQYAPICRGYDPAIEFWSNTIETVLGDFPPVDALAYIRREWQRVADGAGWGWANTHWRFRDGIAHSESSFQLYMLKDGSGDLHVWDQKGRSLGQWTLSQTDAKQRHAAVGEMVALSRLANHGKYRCSRCATVFPEPAAGHYFAGVYCEPCWNAPGPNGTSSVREREAKETYE